MIKRTYESKKMDSSVQDNPLERERVKRGGWEVKAMSFRVGSSEIKSNRGLCGRLGFARE